MSQKKINQERGQTKAVRGEIQCKIQWLMKIMHKVHMKKSLKERTSDTFYQKALSRRGNSKYKKQARKNLLCSWNRKESQRMEKNNSVRW